VLARAPDEQGWRILTEERGRIRREDAFATEEEACEAFWQELKPPDRPVRQRTPQERDRARARTHEAIAEYRKAEEEYRRRGDADGARSS